MVGIIHRVPNPAQRVEVPRPHPLREDPRLHPLDLEVHPDRLQLLLGDHEDLLQRPVEVLEHHREAETLAVLCPDTVAAWTPARIVKELLRPRRIVRVSGDV